MRENLRILALSSNKKIIWELSNAQRRGGKEMVEERPQTNSKWSFKMWKVLQKYTTLLRS